MDKTVAGNRRHHFKNTQLSGGPKKHVDSNGNTAPKSPCEDAPQKT
uniref:Small, acid-soluble spore protein N n=1 Tax=Steinernema glaseri TaxID=37863 RepID=A0A1I7Z6X6_9BILA